MGWIVFMFILIAVGAFLFYASFNIDSGVYVNVLCKGETNERVVCLTFDDGPDPVHTPQVLDVLKKYQAPGAFFCIGKHVRENPSVMERIVQDGHHLGNHSDCHSWNYPFFSRENMYRDAVRCEDSLLRHQKDILTFRPPFGVTNPMFGRFAKIIGYTMIGWNIRSFDTRGESEDKVFRRIIRQIEPGSIILLHDRLPGCASLVARLLEYLKTINYKVIPLDKMFDIPNPFEDDEV